MTKKPATKPARKRGRPPGTPAIEPSLSGARAEDAARDYKTILARVNFAGWYAMRVLALETGLSVEDRIVEGLNHILKQHGKEPVVEKRSRPRDGGPE